MMKVKHPVEDPLSWQLHQQRHGEVEEESIDGNHLRRRLHHHHHHHHRDKQLDVDDKNIETKMEQDYQEEQRIKKQYEHDKLEKQAKKHAKSLKELWADPGIRYETVHGMMIDAGSTGSRLHLYEWEPRILRSEADVQAAVSGRKLTYPGTESRWTDRLQPGLATFADLPDDQLVPALAEYLSPLMDFAKAILHQKEKMYGSFPIFLRATAGMRTLTPNDRARVLDAVRTLFNNNTFCPFYFENYHARVLSGEEEAIYDWAGVNFLLGNLVEQSEGSGTVIDPQTTYGALDLGGASTQISFYEPHEDIMSNLFKLQIGPGKHWNVYAHSYLYFGMEEAINRLHAHLADGKTSTERLINGIYNPCLPGGASTEIRTNIHLNSYQMETWSHMVNNTSDSGYYQAILKNTGSKGDFDACMSITQELLHKEHNTWCDFSHLGDCTFSGVYQPKLPPGAEFLAFSNYNDVWQFLNLAPRSSLEQLRNASRYVCSLSHEDLLTFNDGRVDEDLVDEYCFRSVYVLNLLNGYGFNMSDYITATNVIDGHKVTWALGSMLYEINTLPWEYASPAALSDKTIHRGGRFRSESIFFMATMGGMILLLIIMLQSRRRRNQRENYSPIKDEYP